MAARPNLTSVVERNVGEVDIRTLWISGGMTPQGEYIAIPPPEKEAGERNIALTRALPA
jgi:hypothetical protein